MIRLERSEFALKCTHCGELSGIPASAMDNKTRLATLTESMLSEHAGCAMYAHDPALAKAERQYHARMRAFNTPLGDRIQ